MITLHMPSTKETNNMIDDAALAKMKKGAFLVNVARGELVDEAALFAAVKAGHLGGVGLDVFLKEPPNLDSALFSHPKVITTPHLGASTKEAQVKVAIDVC